MFSSVPIYFEARSGGKWRSSSTKSGRISSENSVKS